MQGVLSPCPRELRRGQKQRRRRRRAGHGLGWPVRGGRRAAGEGELRQRERGELLAAATRRGFCCEALTLKLVCWAGLTGCGLLTFFFLFLYSTRLKWSY
jgi:hypothetical protein